MDLILFSKAVGSWAIAVTLSTIAMFAVVVFTQFIVDLVREAVENAERWEYHHANRERAAYIRGTSDRTLLGSCADFHRRAWELYPSGPKEG